jgi:hypothetical protein
VSVVCDGIFGDAKSSMMQRPPSRSARLASRDSEHQMHSDDDVVCNIGVRSIGGDLDDSSTSNYVGGSPERSSSMLQNAASTFLSLKEGPCSNPDSNANHPRSSIEQWCPIPTSPVSHPPPPLEVCPIRKPSLSSAGNPILLPLQHLFERAIALQALRRRTIVLAATVSIARSIVTVRVGCAIRMVLLQRIALSLLCGTGCLHQAPQPALL